LEKEKKNIETEGDKLIPSDSVKWKNELYVSKQGSRVHTIRPLQHNT